MRKMRLLTVLAAMLLSCGIANAQTVKGDVNNDGKLNTLDVTATADSIMDGKRSGLADVNKDQKVNAADVVTVVKLVQETNYCYLGKLKPTKDNYTIIDGVYTNLNSIDQVVAGYSINILLAANQSGFFCCPSSWNARDLVIQELETGKFFALNAIDNDIADYDVFQTEKVTEAAEYRLKKKADAEAYKEILSKYFYLGTQEPTRQNYTTLEGSTTQYESLDKVLQAKLTLSIEYDERGFLLCPSSWNAKNLVLQNDNNGDFFELTKIQTGLSGYTLFRTEKVEGGAVTVLKTKAAAEEYYKKLHPKYFWLGNTMPTSKNFPTIEGVEVPADTKGLYDTVEGKFYTNKGSGDDFIAGPEL